MEILTHRQIFNFWSKSGERMSDAGYWKRLRALVRRGEFIAVGHDSYLNANDSNQIPYRPELSAMAREVKQEMAEMYGRMNFSVFELCWLNDFLNHLIARNVVFVMAERSYVPFIFEFLNGRHPGLVLRNPTVDDFILYSKDRMVVVVTKPSQGPRNRLLPHVAPPEQWLADILADARISSVFEAAELGGIFAEFGSRYVINRAALLRYARRRGVAERVEELLKDSAV